MLAAQSRFQRLAPALAGALFSAAFLTTSVYAYSPEEQAACQPDAFRLCGADIPDVDRVTACMVRNKTLLSPGCRAFFPDPVVPVTAKKKGAAPKAGAAKAGASAKAKAPKPE